MSANQGCTRYILRHLLLLVNVFALLTLSIITPLIYIIECIPRVCLNASQAIWVLMGMHTNALCYCKEIRKLESSVALTL